MNFNEKKCISKRCLQNVIHFVQDWMRHGQLPCANHVPDYFPSKKSLPPLAVGWPLTPADIFEEMDPNLLTVAELSVCRVVPDPSCCQVAGWHFPSAHLFFPVHLLTHCGLLNAIWQHKTVSTLAQVMACCLMATVLISQEMLASNRAFTHSYS